MMLRGAWVRVLCVKGVLAFVSHSSGAIVQYTGSSAFDAATATHAKEHIDFDDDGFVLAPHTFTPIPPDHYAAQGVTLLKLDARSVGNQPWAHSPPIAAWHTGFDDPITEPYSFVFTQPVASFGMFANDVEASVVVRFNQGSEIFVIPFQGGANIGRFHGFAASSNVIQRIDFTTTDYHIIDDIQFGYVPEPASLSLLGLAGLMALRRPRR